MTTLRSTTEFPCEFDDLIDEDNKTIATIQTLESSSEHGFKTTGITVGKGGVFDVVVDVPELTEEIVVHSLKDLSWFAGVEYVYSRKGLYKD